MSQSAQVCDTESANDERRSDDQGNKQLNAL